MRTSERLNFWLLPLTFLTGLRFSVTVWSPLGILYPAKKSFRRVNISGLYIDPQLKWRFSKVSFLIPSVSAVDICKVQKSSRFFEKFFDMGSPSARRSVLPIFICSEMYPFLPLWFQLYGGRPPFERVPRDIRKGRCSAWVQRRKESPSWIFFAHLQHS